MSFVIPCLISIKGDRDHSNVLLTLIWAVKHVSAVRADAWSAIRFNFDEPGLVHLMGSWISKAPPIFNVANKDFYRLLMACQ